MADNVLQLRKEVQTLRQVDAPLHKGTEPPDNGDMEARVAKLEAGMDYAQRELGDIKATLRGHDGKFDGLRGDITGIRTTDFRLTFGAIIAVALGLAGLMAKGFGWF